VIPTLIDTNVLIYATLADDPRYARSREIVLGPDEAWGKRFVATENLAEMYPNLTGPKMSHPDSPDEAAEKVRAFARLPHLTVLPVTQSVVLRALTLCGEHSVRRQHYFDAQIVAVMLEHGLVRIYTENVDDFKALTAGTRIEVVKAFATET